MKMRRLVNNVKFKDSHTSSFEAWVLPQLGTAYRVARCLTGNSADAEDVVQNAMLRILRFLNTYRGGSARAWVRRIVRNAAMDWLRSNRRPGHVPMPRKREMEGASELHDALLARGDERGIRPRFVFRRCLKFRRCAAQSVGFLSNSAWSSSCATSKVCHTARSRQISDCRPVR